MDKSIDKIKYDPSAYLKMPEFKYVDPRKVKCPNCKSSRRSIVSILGRDYRFCDSGKPLCGHFRVDGRPCT